MAGEFSDQMRGLLRHYDQGRLLLAERELRDLAADSKGRPARVVFLMAILGWVHWKAKEREQAAALWSCVFRLNLANPAARLAAASGLAIYFAEEDQPRRADFYIEVVSMLAEVVGDLMTVTVLNSQLKALADLRHYDEAEEVYLRAVEICEKLERSTDSETVLKAKHQMAKLRFNFATRVLIPCGRKHYARAEYELRYEVSPRYLEAVGPSNDFAACCHWIGFLALEFHEPFEAWEQELSSFSIWNRLQEDFPGRAETSALNLWNILEKMGALKMAKSPGELSQSEQSLEKVFRKHGADFSVEKIKELRIKQKQEELKRKARQKTAKKTARC